MYCNCHAPKPHFKAEMHDAEVSRVKNGFDLFALNNILNYKQTLSLVIRLVEVYFFLYLLKKHQTKCTNVYFKSVKLQCLLSLFVKDQRQLNVNKFVLVKKENANKVLPVLWGTCLPWSFEHGDLPACRFAKFKSCK